MRKPGVRAKRSSAAGFPGGWSGRSSSIALACPPVPAGGACVPDPSGVDSSAARRPAAPAVDAIRTAVTRKPLGLRNMAPSPDDGSPHDIPKTDAARIFPRSHPGPRPRRQRFRFPGGWRTSLGLRARGRGSARLRARLDLVFFLEPVDHLDGDAVGEARPDPALLELLRTGLHLDEGVVPLELNEAFLEREDLLAVVEDDVGVRAVVRADDEGGIVLRRIEGGANLEL